LARCQLESLRRNPRLSSDLGQVLRELPVTLDQSYEQILDSIDKANREHARRLLQCLTVAIRPLRVEELAQVLAVDFDTVGRAGIRIPRGNSADQRAMPVLSAFSSLISIDSRVVQLSHFSVKEFLTSERLANSRRDVSRYHISLQSAHTTLAQACLGILLCLDDHSSRSSFGDFPLAQYAANHWDDHVRFERVSSDPRIRDSIEYFLDGNKSHWKAWHRLRDDIKSLSLSPGDSQVPLFHAAFYGLYGIVELLIAKHPQHVNPRSHSAASPLIAALIRSQFDVAELLYNHRAKVNFQDETRSTLLHVASQVPDHVAPVVEILEWLIEHGADVHARDENDKTPLHLAAEKGPLDTVRTLIMHKSDIKARDRDGRTPLHVAVDRQSLEVVHTLIEHKANVNSRDKKGKTPLHVAVYRQHFDISRVLIEHKASVNERDEGGKTPLHLAAKREHPDIARMLIDHRAHVNEGDDEGMTPLHVAVHHGRHNVVQTLIKHNANLNVRNNRGHTPLHVARDREHHDIAQMLREHSPHTKIQASLRRVTLNVDLDGEKSAVSSIAIRNVNGTTLQMRIHDMAHRPLFSSGCPPCVPNCLDLHPRRHRYYIYLIPFSAPFQFLTCLRKNSKSHKTNNVLLFMDYLLLAFL
jgi:ankyrin repeat protein